MTRPRAASARQMREAAVSNPGHPPSTPTPGLCRYPRDPADWAAGLCGKPGAGTCSTCAGDAPCAEHGPKHGVGWNPKEAA